MNEIRDLIVHLSTEQRTRLENSLFAFAPTAPKMHIPRRAQSEQLLLSFAQQQLWFIQQFAPASAFYNMPNALRLCGKLNLSALQAALDGIRRRHESLRTLYPDVDGVPRQQICDFTPMPIPIVDLSNLAATEQEAHLQSALRAETLRPFHLSHELPQRVRLYRLTEQEHVLLFVTHHIVTDYLSREIYQREFCLIYTAICQGASPQLPDLPIQYADFALWQHKMFETGAWQTQLDYWRAQLGGDLPVLALASDHPHLPTQSTTGTRAGAKETILLPMALIADLKELSRNENVTLFMTMLTAFSLLLHAYSGQEEIMIGTPIANRRQREVEGLIGFFANTLPLRSNVSGNPTIRQLLARIRQMTLSAYDHQELPFEKIVEKIRPIRAQDRPVIYQAFLHFFEAEKPDYTLPGLIVSRLDVEKGIAEFDLMLDIIAVPEGLQASLYYPTDLFERATMQRMLAHLRTILHAMIVTPALPLSQLQILSDTEQEQLLSTWNQTQCATPPALLHDLIEERCQELPQQVALIYREEKLTYGELNQRANQLAHLLCIKGVVRETLVAIFLPRTPSAIMAMLAVLKAGGAFILLDPVWPLERLRAILEQGQVKFVITNQAAIASLETLISAGVQFEMLSLDALAPILHQQSEQNLHRPLQPDSLAYVVYTSGSTGEPKGVMCEHQSLVNYGAFFGRMTALSPRDRRLQFATVGSEIFIAEVFNTLSGGATLIMRPDDAVPTIVEFLCLLDYCKITITSLPVAYWQQWTEAMAAEEKIDLPTSLRVVLTGMDRVQLQPFKIWQEKVGNRLAWYNVYGPAETTVASTCYKADFSLTQTWMRVPIGRPVSNVTHYILDPHMRPVPIGVPGELYIGGIGVARGYLNQPELTTEKFIANPFAPGRLYRTGDFVRYLPSGEIEFIGRKDQQVKIRGYRVELGEIEAHLLQHGDIQEVCVVLSETDGDKTLIAYIVPTAKDAVTAAMLRSYLQTKVPFYMIPAHFVLMAQLPRLFNGKINRRNLPAPEWTQEARGTPYLAPRTATEKQVADIWQAVLQIDKISIDNNFFDLGGHSLLATQIIARINHHFQIKVPLRHMFEFPTITALATLIAQLRAEAVDNREVEALLTELEMLSEEQVTQLLQESPL